MDRKNTSGLLRAWYALPYELREKYKASELEHLHKIATMDPHDIITRAKKVIECWTEDKMNDYLDKFTIATDRINSCMYDLDWVDHNTNTKEQLEICLQVFRLFMRIGIEIRLYQAYFIWCYVSNATLTNNPFCECGWFPKQDDTPCWSLILKNFLYNQPKEVEEELTKGD